MCEISVIVPVYNVEKYLSECLDSLVNQSFKDIEIICINDGSTDGSLEILKDYAKRDSRIRIFSQENQSLGASRNRGLSESQGKYVYFIDSDDYIDLTTLEKLYASAVNNGSDVVLFKFQSFGGDKKIVEYNLEDVFGDIDYTDFKFTYNDIKNHVLNSAYSACVKLYKKEFLDLFDDFYFPEKIYFEDVLFHVKVILRASVMSFVPEKLYHYRMNPISISNSDNDKLDIFEIIDMVESFLREENFYNELEIEFLRFKIAQILQYLFSTNSEDYFNRAKSEFEKIEIKDEDKFRKNLIESYNLVLSSDNLEEFRLSYNNNQLNRKDKDSKLQYKHSSSSYRKKITNLLKFQKR